MSWGSCHCYSLVAAKNQCGQWPLVIFIRIRSNSSGSSVFWGFFVGRHQCFEVFCRGPAMFWDFWSGTTTNVLRVFSRPPPIPAISTQAHIFTSLIPAEVNLHISHTRWGERSDHDVKVDAYTQSAQADLKKLGSFPGLLQKSRRSEIHLARCRKYTVTGLKIRLTWTHLCPLQSNQR